MKRFIVLIITLLVSKHLLADCGRLTKDDTYQQLNAIFDCIEVRLPKCATLNNGADFIKGNYEDSTGGKYLVSGGGVIGDSRTTWTLRSTKSPRQFDVAWTTGPAIGHPQIGSLSIAPKLPKNLSYGVIGKNSHSGWRQGGLVALTQAGDSITVWAYHEGDKNTEHAVNNLVLTRINIADN
jgi:hypothetical protein